MRIPTLLVLGLICLQSCGLGPPRFNVVVNSLAAEDSEPSASYILLPGNEDVSESDLQYQEFARFAKRALEANGFVPASTPEEAKIAVTLSYGIGDPSTQQYSYSLPVWGQTGVSSSNTYGTVSSYGGGMASYSGTTTYTPTYGVTGYSSHVASVTTFFRFAKFTAYDFEEFRRSDKQVEIWSTAVGSTGTSGDLRRVFPVMVAASVPYLGTNSGQQVNITITEESSAVLDILGFNEGVEGDS